MQVSAFRRRRVRGAAIIGLVAIATALTCAPAMAGGDANVASCQANPLTEESPGFRPFLPDCRAYELVTPPYKSGQPTAWNLNQAPPISPDGSRLLGLNFAGFAETGNEEEKPLEYGAIYEFQRTSSGWSTESLEPPASSVARALFVSGSEDLSRSLWDLVSQSSAREEVPTEREPHRPRLLAVRDRTASGPQFTTIGPADPPTAEYQLGFVVRGASPDLSHVVMGIESHAGQLYPGDTTNENVESLYEYSGTGNTEPTLVGVKNHGALGGGHVNEHAELISKCGVSLGSSGAGSTYGAIAESEGSTEVFFTALGCGSEAASGEPEVNELYARVNGTETVDISEPTSVDCEDCKEPATALLGRAAGLFEGASSDGSRVFFLSEQELLTGAKGDSLYEYDFKAPAGKRVSLVAPEAAGVSRVSHDGSHVYFVSMQPLAGASPDESLPSGHQTPKGGEPNLYGYDTASAATAFVATLAPSDEAIWSLSDYHRPIETTSDGEYLVFPSTALLTADDTSTVRQIFEYDAGSKSLVRVSVGQKSSAYPGGYAEDGNTSLAEDTPSLPPTPAYNFSLEPTAYASGVSVATNGTVFFTSGDALAPGAVPARVLIKGEVQDDYVENIYEYRDGNVYLISPGDEQNPLVTEMSRLLGAGQSGQDVFFFSGDSFVPQDTDTQVDWYDAREDGGFPAPPAAAGCSQEACRGPLSAGPLLPAAGGSEVPLTGENLPPPSPPKPPPPPTRAQKLAKALKACSKAAKRKRATCRKQAEKKYGPKGRKSANTRRTK